jgi:hypothetical protein
MKKALTILFSLLVVFAVAQQRQENRKSLTHAPGACPSLVMTPVDNVVTLPSDLVEDILGADIQSYSNVSFAGYATPPYASAGLFVGGTGAGIGIEEGVVLTCGVISDAIGPNSDVGISANLGLPGDAQLTAFAGQPTFDATVLEFDFVPNFDQLYVEFVFGSDEYNEWVDQYNDDFAFFLNGVNIAHVPGTSTAITINTINLFDNSAYYKNNEAYPGPYCNEMDGFTTKLVADGVVIPDVTNHIKLAIGDGGDHALDSFVFIKASSFGGTDPEVPISNWALGIGIFLILTFTVIRFRKMV